MRTLTVLQPFATWIMAGHKTSEVRNFTIPPGPLCIHASKRSAYPAQISAWLMAEYGTLPLPERFEELCRLARRAPKSALLGIITVTHTTLCNSPWGRYRNHLADPEPFPSPIYGIRGKLSLWEIDIPNATGYPCLYNPPA